MQGVNRDFLQLFHPLDRGKCAGNGGVGRNPRGQCRSADGARVGDGIAALFHRVDHQHDLVALEHVHDIRAPLGDLVDHLHFHPRLGDGGRGSAGSHHAKTHGHQLTRDFNGVRLVALLDRQEHLAAGLRIGQAGTGRELRLDEGLAKGSAHTHDFARRFHFRPEDGIDTREFVERKHRLFHAVVGRRDFPRDALLRQRLAGHAACGDFGELQPRGLGDKGHGARSPRVHFQQEDAILPVELLNGELHIHQADDLEAMRELDGLLLDACHRGGR